MPAIPPKASFPSTADAPGLLAKLREFALVGAGLAANNRLDAFLRISDLVDAGVIQVRQSALNGGGAGTGGPTFPNGRPVVVEPAIDRTPPPVPTGFLATSGVTQILFETAAPIYRQGHGHARTKIYAAPASPLPTFADAVLYTDFPGNIGVAPFDPASELRLWATWTSVDGVESEPAGGINGIAATTGLLEDQHIANLTVGKLLAGSLSVGQYIQSADYVAGVSGWRIQTLSGGGAFMEINGGASIGGLLVFADHIRSSNYVAGVQGYRFKSDGTGQIGGVLFTVNGIQSANYVLNTSGFRFAYDGTGQIGGFSVLNDAIQSTNFVLNTSGWKITKDGDILTPKFSVVGGDATFKGTLTAAQIDVGSAGTPVTFRDSSMPTIALWSIAHGQLSFHGNTNVAGTYPPVTGANVTFTCGNVATAIERRVRTGTVRFSIIATALVDHYFSLWYRLNGGAWTFLYKLDEPQANYGTVGATYQLDQIMASGDSIEFGMAITDSFGAPFNPAATDIRFGNLTVQGINF